MLPNNHGLPGNVPPSASCPLSSMCPAPCFEEPQLCPGRSGFGGASTMESAMHGVSCTGGSELPMPASHGPGCCQTIVQPGHFGGGMMSSEGGLLPEPINQAWPCTSTGAFLQEIDPNFVEASASSTAAPCMEATKPFEVHSFLADNALACPPGAPSHEHTLQQSLSPQAPENSIAKVATAVPARAPKRVSIIKPYDEEDLPIRPALVKIDGGKVLAATVEQNSGVVEWEWARAADAIGLKTDKNSQFLSRNSDHHYSELIQAEISQDQIMYRGVGTGARGQHSMGSSAFMLVILLIALTKQHAPDIKAAALSLAVGILKTAVATMTAAVSCAGIVYGRDKRYHEQTLEIDSTGIVKNLHTLMMQHPGCIWAWSQLMVKGFCNYKITSACTHPTLWDLIILLAWAKNSPGVKKVWSHFGQILWPKILFTIGCILDNCAVLRSQQPIEQLPLLKSKKGKTRHVHWINKLVLLKKMRLVKKARKQAALSHGDVVPVNAQIVLAEEFLACSLYAKKIKEAYQDCFHFCVHWDPSSYDVETFVGILFSTQCGPEGMASYLPIQNLRPVLKAEVDPEIQALSSINKLTRISGYCEIRALSHAMLAVGMPLQKFVFPQALIWRPLLEHEMRVWEHGEFWITNSRTGEKIPQIPSGWTIATQPLLVSFSDQGGINRAGLDYMAFKLGLSLHVGFDPFHRSWNDIKDSLKKSKGDLYKCFLSFALLWNCNYGPAGSKEWFQKNKL